MQNDGSAGPDDPRGAVFKTELEITTLPDNVPSEMAEMFWAFRELLADRVRAGMSFEDASSHIRRIAGAELGQLVVAYFESTRIY